MRGCRGRWVRAAARGLGAAATSLLVAGLVTSCTQGGASSGDTLTVYSGQHVQTTEALVAAFERATGIGVSLRSDDEDVLADQIVTEGANSPADVFYTENSPPLQYLASKGLLSAVEPATLDDTPARFNSPDGRWVGVSARVSVMVYNTTLLTPGDLPTSALQLADPKWQRSDRSRRERDGLPAHRHFHRPHLWGRRCPPLAGGGQGQRGRPLVPGQRDSHRPGQPRSGRAGDHQSVLLVPRTRPGRRRRDPLGHRVLRPPRRRLRPGRLGRGHLEVVPAPSARRSASSRS